MSTVGQMVTRGLARAKVSQSALAERTGLTRSWVGSLATDRMAKPNTTKMRRVADELGLDYREMLAVTNQLGALADAAPAGDGGEGSDLTAAIRELVDEVRQARQEQKRANDVMVDLLGLLAGERGLLSGSGAGDDVRTRQGAGQ